MGWTMEQLFQDGIMPREMCCPKKQEYKDNLHLLDELESDMKKELTEEQANCWKTTRSISVCWQLWKMRNVLYREWHWEHG